MRFLRAPIGMNPRHLVLATVVSFVVLTTAGCTTSTPSPRPTSTPSAVTTKSPAITARLKDEVYSRLPPGARTAPAITWEDPKVGSSRDAVDLSDDKKLLLAAACEGTGSLTITVTGKPDKVLACANGMSVGPIDLTPFGDPPAAVEFDVKATSGTPQYFATAVAVRPSKSARP